MSIFNQSVLFGLLCGWVVVTFFFYFIDPTAKKLLDTRRGVGSNALAAIFALWVPLVTSFSWFYLIYVIILVAVSFVWLHFAPRVLKT